jgi:hypothetical protein
VIREIELIGRSFDYGELISNAVEHLLCGAAISQLGANFD